MIPRMNKSDETSQRPYEPNQEPVSSKATSTWPFQRDDGFENPSLERYTDLRFVEEKRGHRRWVMAIAGALSVLVLIVLGFMVAIYAEARSDEARQVDAIIVLGAAQYNGRPTEVFAARLQHGLDLYNEGHAPWIIVTGGRQEGDAFTEADTGKAWLMDRGVSEDVILMENEGRDTWENLEGAMAAGEPHDIETILIVSDGFHLFRSERMANAIGFEPYSSPAPNSPIIPWGPVEFGYIVRETVAVIVQIPRWLF